MRNGRWIEFNWSFLYVCIGCILFVLAIKDLIVIKDALLFKKNAL